MIGCVVVIATVGINCAKCLMPTFASVVGSIRSIFPATYPVITEIISSNSSTGVPSRIHFGDAGNVSDLCIGMLVKGWVFVAANARRRKASGAYCLRTAVYTTRKHWILSTLSLR